MSPAALPCPETVSEAESTTQYGSSVPVALLLVSCIDKGVLLLASRLIWKEVTVKGTEIRKVLLWSERPPYHST